MNYADIQQKCGLLSDDDFAKRPIAPGSNRRTGRTTKLMVQAIVDHIQFGRRVLFICARPGSVNYLRAKGHTLVRLAGFDTALFSVSCSEVVAAHYRPTTLTGIPEILVYDHDCTA